MPVPLRVIRPPTPVVTESVRKLKKMRGMQAFLRARCLLAVEKEGSGWAHSAGDSRQSS